jgi:sugar phosphate permease
VQDPNLKESLVELGKNGHEPQKTNQDSKLAKLKRSKSINDYESFEQDKKGSSEKIEGPIDHFQDDETLKRKRKEQAKVWLITYFAYVCVHIERGFWSMSKPEITTAHPEYTPDVLATFDTADLLAYAIFLYINGVLGEVYDQRKLLTIAYINLSIVYVMLGIPGFFGWYHRAWFYAAQIFLGINNAFLFPCCIAIMGNWFPKQNRGFFVGLWATCNNTGNILGIQFAALLLKVLGLPWPWLMVIAASLTLIFAFLIFFLITPDPEDRGFIIEELTNKEALIAAASDKDVHSSILSKSKAGAAPEKVAEQIRKS